MSTKPKGKCLKWSKKTRYGKRRCLKRGKSTRRRTYKSKSKAKKGRCLKWSKGRTRCLKRAKR